MRARVAGDGNAAVAPARAEDLSPVGDWHPGGELTVGAEDELMLVGSDDRLLGAEASPIRERVCGNGISRTGSGSVVEEIYADQVELVTVPCADAEGVATAVRELRRVIRLEGARTMAAGLHPDGPFGAVSLVRSPRFDAIAAEYAGLLRTPTAAFQVHVGLPDTQSALIAFRALRNRLALFRALAAASPFWHGRDSGLASARAAVIRAYPHTGLPPALPDWEAYGAAVQRFLHATATTDTSRVWWELRPRPKLGTIEVRVMDAQPSLARIAGLTALVQGVAAHALTHPDDADLPPDVLGANDHRVVRHGLDTTVVDVDGATTPLRDVAGRTLAEARAALRAEGRDRPLDVVEGMLHGIPEPDRQRRLHADGGMPALLGDLVRRTAAEDG